MTSQKTIAKQLDDKAVHLAPSSGTVHYEAMTGVYTFEDGSQAKQIIRFEPCKPFITPSGSTASLRRVAYWLAI